MRNGLYPYEYVDDWEKFNETLLPEKQDFYSHLNVEDITDADYAHSTRVCQDFKAKVFENFRNMFLEIYELDSPKSLSALGLAWQAALKKTKAKLNFLTYIDFLLMVQKGITGGMCHSIYPFTKTNNKHIKDYDKNKESLYIKYCDVNNLYG